MPRACPVELQRCHGLVPWSFNDATGLPRGVLTLEATLAANVNLHGARPWHPSVVIFCFASGKREAPRDKPVASRFEPDKPVASRFERLTSPWHLFERLYKAVAFFGSYPKLKAKGVTAARR